MDFYLDKPLQLDLPVQSQRLKEADLGDPFQTTWS